MDLQDHAARRVLVRSFFSAILLICCQANSPPSRFNVVEDYGAVGDGTTNDTLAFVKAWKSTCNSEAAIATMLVPKDKTFLVHPVTFAGPCKPSKINFVLLGTMIAPDSPEAWKGRNQGRWLIFQGVKGLHVHGHGLIDGRGHGWWDILCRTHPHLPGCVKLAPTALSFIDCEKVVMCKIEVVNSPQTHILIWGSRNVKFNRLVIESPGTTPNTDGIHISSSHGITIRRSTFGCGDDCVSIGDQTSNIYIKDVNCGPGHGISIGSLGRSGNEVKVENIKVSRVHFNKTTNGVRIKTWQVGRGEVRGVMFKYMTFTEAQNPIIIDQNYCDVRGACKPTKTGVHITDVRYSEAFGTSKSKVAINLNCSDAIPCTNILLDNIQVASSIPGGQVISSCNNAYGSARGYLEPESCLLD